MKPSFVVLLTGNIETAELPSVDNIYCKYSFVYGNDWEQVGGLKEGLSARGQKSTHRDRIVIGLSLEATFSSTNPFRWPQLLLSCYGTDGFGNDIVRGYGAVHIPTVPGRCVKRVALFVPEASTSIQKLFGWLTGKRAEFIDPRIVASNDGRHVTRVRSQGFINVTLNVLVKDLKKFGYDVTQSSIDRVSQFPLPSFQVETSGNVHKPSTSAPITVEKQERRPSPTPNEVHSIPRYEVARDEASRTEQLMNRTELSRNDQLRIELSLTEVPPQTSNNPPSRPLPVPRARLQPKPEVLMEEELEINTSSNT